MLKLIHADLYKAFHRIYLYVFMAVMGGIAILYNCIFASQGAPRETAFHFSLMLLAYPLYFVVMFVDIILAEENKEHTLKNTISFGISRTKLFFAKNISAIIVTMVVAAVTVAVFYVSGLIALKAGTGYTTAFLTDLGSKIAVALLVYVAAIVMGTFLATVIKRNGLFIFAYFGALLVPPLVFHLLRLANSWFKYAENAMLMSQTDILMQATSAQMLNVVWVALAHIVVFAILGAVLCRRQEIN
jgi:ABC-type transport system involved in multi-copper enzyme maturation permease subunit